MSDIVYYSVLHFAVCWRLKLWHMSVELQYSSWQQYVWLHPGLRSLNWYRAEHSTKVQKETSRILLTCQHWLFLPVYIKKWICSIKARKTNAFKILRLLFYRVCSCLSLWYFFKFFGTKPPPWHLSKKGFELKAAFLTPRVQRVPFPLTVTIICWCLWVIYLNLKTGSLNTICFV